MFGWIDWIIVALYFAAMAYLGFHFSRQNRSFNDFMFGGQNIPWLAIGISLIATSVSASTFLGNPADAYAQDMRLLMLSFGSLASIAVVNAVFIPRFRESGIRSAYELLERRFDRRIRLLAAVLYSLHLLLRTGLLVYVPSLVLMKITGMPLYASILLMSAFGILYTYHGGIKAVTWTDVIQFLIFFLSGVACLLFIADRTGGLSETWRLASEAGKTRWLDFSFDPTSDRNFISAVLVYIVFEVAIRGCDQQFVQRYLSSRNLRQAHYSSLSSAVLGIFVGLIFFSLGAFLFVYYQVLKVEVLPAGIGINEVFPHFILNTLPTGLKGLLVAAIMAAAMSSLSSAYTALSNTTVVDLLRSDSAEGTRGAGKSADRARAGGAAAGGARAAGAASTAGAAEGEKKGLAKARFWVLIWGLVGTLAAFLCVLGEASILTKALFFTSLFTGPLLALFVLAFFFPRAHPTAILLGTLGGMLSLLPFSAIPILPPGAWTPFYSFAWPWNPLISLLSTLALTGLTQMVLPRNPAATPARGEK